MAGKKKKKLITKNAVKAAAFLCLIALVVLGCNHIFGFADAEHTEHIMKEFYQQDKDTVDVVYFGTSASQRAYVVPLAFHEDGVACYTMASGTQPFILTEYLMKEALKTQHPKLFIVELRGTCQDKDSVWDVAERRIVDNMKLSQNKIDTIRTVIDYAEGGSNTIDLTGRSYILPLLKYHGRWNPSKQPKYWGNIDYYQGYTLDYGVCFKTKKVSSRPMDFASSGRYGTTLRSSIPAASRTIHRPCLPKSRMTSSLLRVMSLTVRMPAAFIFSAVFSPTVYRTRTSRSMIRDT